jgi:Asp-tRNA(Asn)/Glu-tRNA(Gln) amidotransferase A subunit family amidase
MSLLGLLLFLAQDTAPTTPPASAPSGDDVAAAARVIGAAFTAEEIDLMLPDVRERLASFERLRDRTLDNALAPALYFLPDPELALAAGPPARQTRGTRPALDPTPVRPDDLEELSYASITKLSRHLHARTVTCEELTEMFLARLVRLDEKLLCVVSLTEERALAQARVLDQELERGSSRGLLHGIPWVAKDLLAVRGTTTTWGAAPFEDQVIDADAAVVELLDEAGAVLIAKVTLGALAWGDVWFGGKTRNPWNTEEGSSGSSAGPASAVAAGCAPFGIGSETLGSIVSPSHRCGNSSLRPTFGRVSRHGAMALAWSMDKLGPICRSAEDAAIVLDAIHGRDPRDPTTRSLPFHHDADADDVEGWRVGYLEDAFEGEAFAPMLEELRALGVELVAVELPDYPVGDMTFVLSAEAAAAFDEFSAGDADDRLVRQERHAWPNVFRHARLIPAVDYLRANRLRTLLVRDVEAALASVVALVHPSYAGDVLGATNLTGHPTFVAPCGFEQDGTPYSISFTGRLFGETELMALARAWQASTDHHLQHPDL